MSTAEHLFGATLPWRVPGLKEAPMHDVAALIVGEEFQSHDAALLA